MVKLPPTLAVMAWSSGWVVMLISADSTGACGAVKNPAVSGVGDVLLQAVAVRADGPLSVILEVWPCNGCALPWCGRCAA